MSDRLLTDEEILTLGKFADTSSTSEESKQVFRGRAIAEAQRKADIKFYGGIR